MGCTSGNHRLCGVAIAAALLLGAGARLPGQVIPLSDTNAQALIDAGSQRGLFSFGPFLGAQFIQNWFWYRVGTNAEASIDTLGPPAISRFSATRDVTLTYSNALFTDRGRS